MQSHDMVQTVRVLSLTAEDRVRTQASPCVSIVTRDRFFHCHYDSINASFTIAVISSSKCECRFIKLLKFSLCSVLRKFNFRSLIWLTLLRTSFVPLFILPRKVIMQHSTVSTFVFIWLRKNGHEHWNPF